MDAALPHRVACLAGDFKRITLLLSLAFPYLVHSDLFMYAEVAAELFHVCACSLLLFP